MPFAKSTSSSALLLLRRIIAMTADRPFLERYKTCGTSADVVAMQTTILEELAEESAARRALPLFR